MTTIIAGRFGQQDTVHQALTALENAGFLSDQITSFYVNPAGQHDQYPVGGDRDESPGAEHSDHGSAVGSGAGAAVGATAGAATAPVTGPAGIVTGALLGAYVGSLVGSMVQTDNAEDMPVIRKSGMLVAVAVADTAEEQRAIDTLHAIGASDMERADGQILNGDWADFDPLSSPQFVS